jgi:hypothetical protein
MQKLLLSSALNYFRIILHDWKKKTPWSTNAIHISFQLVR